MRVVSIQSHDCARCGRTRHTSYLMMVRGVDGKRYLCPECASARYQEARSLLEDARDLLNAEPTVAGRLSAFLSESP